VDIVLIDGIFQFAGDELVLVDIVRPDNERREERILTDRLDAAPELQAAVAKGEVKATQAKRIAVVARGDKKKQAELAKKAAEANKSGNKKARAKVDDEIEQQRVAKAEAKGKTVKMRALSDDALSEKGARLAKHFESLLKEAKIDPATFDLRKWVEEDEKLAVAFTFGALEALKAAAGLKITLEV
jgi:hypothetical protein